VDCSIGKVQKCKHKLRKRETEGLRFFSLIRVCVVVFDTRYKRMAHDSLMNHDKNKKKPTKYEQKRKDREKKLLHKNMNRQTHTSISYTRAVK
jgi:hypothetical protein